MVLYETNEEIKDIFPVKQALNPPRGPDDPEVQDYDIEAFDTKSGGKYTFRHPFFFAEIKNPEGDDVFKDL